MNCRTVWQWQGPAEGSCPWLTGDEAPPSATSLQYTPPMTTRRGHADTATRDTAID